MAALDLNELLEQLRQRKKKGVVNAATPKKSTWKQTLLSVILTAIVAAIYFYFVLPPLNFQCVEFYKFLILTLVAYFVISAIVTGCQLHAAAVVANVKVNGKIALVVLGALLVIVAVGGIFSAPLFQAQAYTDLMIPEIREFSQDVAEISFDQIPMLDADSAQRLGDRKLGELSDLVSQFEVSDDYAQINYQGRPTRVTYLEYGDIFKWWNNRDEGLPAIIAIDMVTQEVTVNRLEEGMKYSPSELFSRDLMRHLRFNFPTFIFGEVNFEIDESGRPYWIASVLTRSIGLFGGTDVKGAVLVDAITGECTYYDLGDVPAWVDRVYDPDLVVEQYDNHGKYQGGFWNSLFGQSGVTVTTDGYNYIAMDDDVWMYTGVTSITGDQSNVGFLLVNLRTGEPRYYTVPGATEYSAMDSAEGAVQHLGYTATFPLLLNIADEPTYFMSLKDASDLVKMYAMVNVGQYQIVATGTTVQACQEHYYELMKNAGLIENTPAAVLDTKTVTGPIAQIRSAVLDGNTYYYLQLQGKTTWYRISAAEAPLAVILDAGDYITITYVPGEEEILPATAVERK